MAVNVYTTGNQLSENVSRQELVDWVNSFLKLNFTKVENFCSGKDKMYNSSNTLGSAYLQFLDAVWPGLLCIAHCIFF